MATTEASLRKQYQEDYAQASKLPFPIDIQKNQYGDIRLVMSLGGEKIAFRKNGKIIDIGFASSIVYGFSPTEEILYRKRLTEMYPREVEQIMGTGVDKLVPTQLQ